MCTIELISGFSRFKNPFDFLGFRNDYLPFNLFWVLPCSREYNIHIPVLCLSFNLSQLGKNDFFLLPSGKNSLWKLNRFFPCFRETHWRFVFWKMEKSYLRPRGTGIGLKIWLSFRTWRPLNPYSDTDLVWFSLSWVNFANFKFEF